MLQEGRMNEGLQMLRGVSVLWHEQSGFAVVEISITASGKESSCQ